MNVWRLGMWASDWRLAARLTEEFLDLYLVNPSPEEPTRARAYWLLPGELPIFFGDYSIPGAYPNFPYGFVVEED
jgi:hypothetical protein